MAQLHPDHHDAINAAFHRPVATGEPYHTKYRIRRPIDEELLTISAQGEIARHEAGKPMKMIGVHIGVTRRRETEEQVKARAELFSALFHPHPIGLIEGDIYGRVHNASAARPNQMIQAATGPLEIIIGLEADPQVSTQAKLCFPAPPPLTAANRTRL